MAANLFDQSNRLLTLSVDGDANKLMIENFSAQEALSTLYSIKVQAVSTDSAIAPQDVIGKEAKILMRSETLGERTFHGYVTHLNAGTLAGPNLRRYELVLHPWLWFLTCRTNCKIFQQKTTIDIVSDIFAEHGFNDFDTGQV